MIETAKDEHDAQPAADFIDKLERSKKDADLRRAADIAIRFEDFSLHGELRIPRELNDLEEGIREIKAGDVRLPFYEAAVDGHPNLVRLTHGFLKKSWRTPAPHIRRAIAIRREDRARP